jgi:hypothetical protein
VCHGQSPRNGRCLDSNIAIELRETTKGERHQEDEGGKTLGDAPGEEGVCTLPEDQVHDKLLLLR